MVISNTKNLGIFPASRRYRYNRLYNKTMHQQFKKKRRKNKKQRSGGPAMMALMAAPLLMPLLGKLMGQ